MSQDMLPKWHLFTEWFKPKDPNREQEFLQCLEENLACPDIQEVHLLCEGEPPAIEHPKLTLIQPEKRPTYASLIKTVSTHLKGKHIVIANNDISFQRFNNFSILPNQVACCTRYEIRDGNPVWYREANQKNPGISQDAWFFKSPITLGGGHFYMGTPGCDNRIAWLFHASGNHVFNPGHNAMLLHRHENMARNYAKERLPNPYLHVNEDGNHNIIFNKRAFPADLQPPIHQWHVFRSLIASRAECVFTIRLLVQVLSERFNSNQ